MSKFLALGLAALALLAMSCQQASAWSKFNFGIGANINWEGGGNTVLWGMMRGAPSHGAMDGGYGGYPTGGYEAAPMSPAPVPTPAAPKPMPGGSPGVAQPVGYYPYTYPAAGYYQPAPAYVPSAGYSYPSYWR